MSAVELKVEEAPGCHAIADQNPTQLWCKSLPSCGKTCGHDTSPKDNESGFSGSMFNSQALPTGTPHKLVPLSRLQIHTYLLSLKMCSMTMTPVNNTYSFSRSPVVVSPVPPSENVFQDQSSQSEEDEQEVESGMQSEHPEDFDQVEVNHTSDAENGPADADQYRKSKKSSRILTMASKDSDLAQEDALGVQSKLQAHRHGRLPLAAIKKAQALGMHAA
ncbi:hypothetical protein EV401DRAFT_1890459 [Pisolithus croceorrhizus]|nr:hypothetical protein EV401DRAFT_1890459 [Pisolithus croceorrhizus]